MQEKKYLRADPDVLKHRCRNCNKIIYKNDSKQIVYFCSKTCRKGFRKGG